MNLTDITEELTTIRKLLALYILLEHKEKLTEEQHHFIEENIRCN